MMAAAKRAIEYSLGILLGYRCFKALRDYCAFCQAHPWQSKISRRGLSVMARNLAVSPPSSLPPHSVESYGLMLRTLLSSDEVAVTMLRELLVGEKRDDVANIYLRHDVDFLPSGLEQLCAMEAEFGLASSIYILVAREEFFCAPYNAAHFRPLLDELLSQGFEVGLHTVAYAAPVEEMLDCFSREIEQFQATFGYPPTSFTFHGWPEHVGDRYARRAMFAEKLLSNRDRFANFAGKMSDYLLKPVIGISDSGVPWPRRSREIRHFYPGEIVCVLNHPCYWSRAGYLKYKSSDQ